MGVGVALCILQGQSSIQELSHTDLAHKSWTNRPADL
jgi:hypothetical protein